MITFPNAKINLGLQIVKKRDDGFHDLKSCFFPIGIYDVLEIIKSENTEFTTSGIEIPGGTEDNLCLRAYNLLKEPYQLTPVHIHLHKNIPIGAGMGGGSADAACTIKLLNNLFELNLSISQMEDYARTLGSDCAFFIKNKPVLAYEKGDKFQDLEISLEGKILLLVFPNIHISTKEAYTGVRPSEPTVEIKDLLQLPPQNWTDLKNDFEGHILDSKKELRELKETLRKSGALYASMTGSGSAFYGIFEKAVKHKNMFPSNYRVWEIQL